MLERERGPSDGCQAWQPNISLSIGLPGFGEAAGGQGQCNVSDISMLGERISKFF